MTRYRPRIVDSELETLLGALGAVVLEGPKGCGKTETARRVAASEVRLDVDVSARQAAELDPALVLGGEVPRLIDEWQVVPDVWNHVRRAVDDRGSPGQFLLTGSAVPRDDATRHTGAGRFARLRMRPMALIESGHSTGEVSLAALLRGEAGRAPDPGLTVSDVVERIAVGGWPAIQGLPVDGALRAMRAYVEEVTRTDIRRVDGVAHEPERVAHFLRSVARNVSTHASMATLASDVGPEADKLSRTSAHDYHDALVRLMVIEDQPAWGPHLRSRSRVRTAPVRHFVDPAMAVASMRATPDRLLGDIEYCGFLFQSLVVRDLRVYAQPLEAQVYHYRDNTDLEVDAIVETADGAWGAFEVKLGAGAVDAAAESLIRFADRVDTRRSGEPAVLAVITGTGYAYIRDDGIAVVPIGVLGP
jgi:predicted AAA+ superfamily ATPase